MSEPEWDAQMSATDRLKLQSWIHHRDADAFKQLTLRYSGLVYRTCLRITSNPSDAEDLTQESFATLAAQAKPPRAPLGAWLHRVATNRALNEVKVRGRRAVREKAYAERTPKTTQIAWSDIDGLVDEAIAELPDDLRAIVIAHFLESESYTSIAERLGTTRQTAANRIQKGVALIRRSLRKRGVTISAPTLASFFAAESVVAAQVPAPLTAALGKVAIAGVTKPASAVNVLGGIAAMKSQLVGAGVVVAVVAGSAATAVQFREQRQELKELRQTNTQLAARAADVDALEAELIAVRAESARLVNELKETETAAGGAVRSETTSANNARDEHANAVTGQTIQAETTTVHETENGETLYASMIELNGLLLNNPFVYESQILRAANDRYAALYGMLKLPGEVQGRLRAALAAHVRNLVASGVSLGDIDDGIIDTQQLRETLSTILTPEEMATWEAFENDAPYFQSQQRYATEMVQVIPGLSVDNRTMASAVLAEEYLLGKEMIDPNAASSRAERLTQEFHALDRAKARIAQTYSDADQFALVNDYIQQQQAVIQAKLDQHDGGGALHISVVEPLTLGFGSS